MAYMILEDAPIEALRTAAKGEGFDECGLDPSTAHPDAIIQLAKSRGLAYIETEGFISFEKAH